MTFRLAPPGRSRHVVRDGRRVGWTEWGPPDGAPVLLCTGAGMSSSLGLDGGAVEELGVRLLCVDRAGLGLSEPDPHKTFESHCRDVEAVLAAGRVERPGVIGFSQGAPFAVALAGAGVVRAIALVAGQDDFSFPLTRQKLAPEVRRMVESIGADPGEFESSFAARATAEALWSLVLGTSSPADRAVYEGADFGPAYRRCLEEGFARGPAGYVRDLALAMGPWPTRPEDVGVRVTLWYGMLDTSPVHSPDFGATLERRFPKAERRALAEEGSSLLWTRSRDILRDLLRAG